MADHDTKNDVSAVLSPRIIFVRIGKDKSKDAIEDEIFKCINEVLEEPNGSESASQGVKNCITLPDFAGCRILQVAVGPEYLGLLFHDGRVGRFKCVTKNLDSTKKLWSSQRSEDEPNFQVQSDEAFARQLQNELLNGGATSSKLNFPGRSPVWAGSSFKFSPKNRNARSSFRTGFANGSASNRTPQRFVPSSMSPAGNSNTIAVTRECETEEVDLERSSGTSSAQVDSKSCGSQTEASAQTNSPSKSVDPKENMPLPLSSNTDEESQEGIQVSERDKSKVQGSSHQKRVSSEESLPRSGRSMSSSQSSNTRQSISSPTLLHRTVFTTNYPIMRQFSAPFLLPAGGVSIPVYSTSSNGPVFGSRGTSLRLEPHVVRAQLAEAGAFARGPRTASAQGSEDPESKCASYSDADFCYPEIGGVEWLEVENVSGLMKLLILQ